MGVVNLVLGAASCGSHHLAHGVRLAFEGRAGRPLDLVSVLAGPAVGVT